MGMGGFNCDGGPPPPGGAWSGHVLPGTLFIAWSLHWLQGSMRHYFQCQAEGVPYVSKSHYGLLGIPRVFEPIIVIAMALMGAVLEVTWHDDGYQNLICEADSKRAGHINGGAINNWQHLQMYVCFITSQAVMLVGHTGILPAGTEKAFLCLSFLGETVLMGLHEKEEPLDRFVHAALTWSMIWCTVACGFEALLPRSYLATCGRVTGTMMQGLLFVIIARMMYERHPAWDRQNGEDFAPYQYAKIVVMQTIAVVFAVYAVLHMSVQAYLQHKQGTLFKDRSGARGSLQL